VPGLMLASGDVVDVDLGVPFGLAVDSAAHCQHVGAVASKRLTQGMGNVDPVTLAQIRNTRAALRDF
jgi:mRNA-degrading endonuclease toxin of MazEF toxin-antitoxin module